MGIGEVLSYIACLYHERPRLIQHRHPIYYSRHNSGGPEASMMGPRPSSTTEYFPSLAVTRPAVVASSRPTSCNHRCSPQEPPRDFPALPAIPVMGADIEPAASPRGPRGKPCSRVIMQFSNADEGFFQRPPVLVNQFHDDVSYRRCFRRELPSAVTYTRPVPFGPSLSTTVFLPAEIRARTEAEVAALGQEVLADHIFAWITDAERNKPYVRGSGRGVFGRRAGELVTTEGWRELQNFAIAKGQVKADTVSGRARLTTALASVWWPVLTTLGTGPFRGLCSFFAPISGCLRAPTWDVRPRCKTGPPACSESTLPRPARPRRSSAGCWRMPFAGSRRGTRASHGLAVNG